MKVLAVYLSVHIFINQKLKIRFESNIEPTIFILRLLPIQFFIGGILLYYSETPKFLQKLNFKIFLIGVILLHQCTHWVYIHIYSMYL